MTSKAVADQARSRRRLKIRMRRHINLRPVSLTLAQEIERLEPSVAALSTGVTAGRSQHTERSGHTVSDLFPGPDKQPSRKVTPTQTGQCKSAHAREAVAHAIGKRLAIDRLAFQARPRRLDDGAHLLRGISGGLGDSRLNGSVHVGF